MNDVQHPNHWPGRVRGLLCGQYRQVPVPLPGQRDTTKGPHESPAVFRFFDY